MPLTVVDHPPVVLPASYKHRLCYAAATSTVHGEETPSRERRRIRSAVVRRNHALLKSRT
jgi:hypothetical protein